MLLSQPIELRSNAYKIFHYALCKRHIELGNMAMLAENIACNYIKQATTHEITQNTVRKIEST